jgi:hypothetical protein
MAPKENSPDPPVLASTVDFKLEINRTVALATGLPWGSVRLPVIVAEKAGTATTRATHQAHVRSIEVRVVILTSMHTKFKIVWIRIKNRCTFPTDI